MCIHMHMHQCRNGRIGIFAAWQNHNKIHTQPEHKQAHTHTCRNTRYEARQSHGAQRQGAVRNTSKQQTSPSAIRLTRKS